MWISTLSFKTVSVLPIPTLKSVC